MKINRNRITLRQIWQAHRKTTGSAGIY